MDKNEHQDKLDNAVTRLQMKYGRSVVKTGAELLAEKRFDQTAPFDDEE